MISKDEAFDKFKIYKVEVENQLGRKIEVLRSDRGVEHFPEQFTKLCETYGLDMRFRPPTLHNKMNLPKEKIEPQKKRLTHD